MTWFSVSSRSGANAGVCRKQSTRGLRSPAETLDSERPETLSRPKNTSSVELAAKGLTLVHTDTCVLDALRPIAINLRAPDGVKTVRVRFPSDYEWAAPQRRRKVIVKNLGRGMSETTVAGGEEVDAALVAKIRVQEENPVEVDGLS